MRGRIMVVKEEKKGGAARLSHIIYESNSFRKSTPLCASSGLTRDHPLWPTENILLAASPQKATGSTRFEGHTINGHTP